MALIEHLERKGWQEFLEEVFRYVLDVLKEDRHRPLGSSGDDLRSWLTAGGVGRVRYREPDGAAEAAGPFDPTAAVPR